MSLAALAIRACAFLTLYGRTYAEDRVFDSTLQVIDELRRDAPLPFITVAIDEAEGSPTDHNLLASTETIALVIEVGIGRQVEVEGADDRIRLPLTDPGLEWALDLVSYQIVALLTSDTGWGDLFRRFVMRYRSVVRLRGGMTEAGDRFAARQIVLELAPISDPDMGILPAAGDPFADFIAALRTVDAVTHPDLAIYPDLADALEAAILATELDPWARAAARLGIARESAYALGVVPVVAPLVGNPDPTVTTVEVFGDPITEDRADEIDAGEGDL